MCVVRRVNTGSFGGATAFGDDLRSELWSDIALALDIAIRLSTYTGAFGSPTAVGDYLSSELCCRT